MAETSYIDEARYLVRFSKKVEAGVFVYRPRQTKLDMKGSTLNAIIAQGDGDKIKSAELIEANSTKD
ncbi:hypothetical protein SAMN04515647_3722 [Cohaesibacter sp. ES.047]|uniref:hypothetical protein n=1 Tax=Cohaesibacter sp. ES.047 TaxID=1798205 RepID=UPI000BB77313|nr:hypothetical protein [Cohaesibacter sp. ES.047]SNY93427.1 hypothetical protein SAMN04515647_3722 [Cohaesibacter sp. ES.047]